MGKHSSIALLTKELETTAVSPYHPHYGLQSQVYATKKRIIEKNKRSVFQETNGKRRTILE